MKRKPFIVKMLVVLGLLLLLLFLLMFKPVNDRLPSVLTPIKSYLSTAAGIVMGGILISWGIAAIELPVLGVPMILAGLAMIAYNVWPLITQKTLANG
jgi:hypothetical protein